MSSSRKRRAAVESDESDEEPTQNTQQRRRGPAPEESEEDEEEDQTVDNMDVDGEEGQDQVVKKLVRYALACEYQRLPIKRIGISERVFGTQRVPFKRVFEQAQVQLRTKFGMEMVELPVKEKITMKDKRSAQKSKGASKPPVSYILSTILPPAYRTPEIIRPSLFGNSEDEAAYTALCSMVVAIISLSPGKSIPDSKLDRYLGRLNANKNMPMDKTENVLKKMVQQGYVMKVVDRSGDEETIDWVVGPRGKVEIGSRGVHGLVKEVYGASAPEDLQERLTRSLGIVTMQDLRNGEDGGDAEEEPGDVSGQPSARRQSDRLR